MGYIRLYVCHKPWVGPDPLEQKVPKYSCCLYHVASQDTCIWDMPPSDSSCISRDRKNEVLNLYLWSLTHVGQPYPQWLPRFVGRLYNYSCFSCNWIDPVRICNYKKRGWTLLHEIMSQFHTFKSRNYAIVSPIFNRTFSVDAFDAYNNYIYVHNLKKHRLQK